MSPGPGHPFTRQSYRSYYAIKYLALTGAISMILALIHLWRWPAAVEHTRTGLVFVGVTLLCVFVTRHRLLVLSLPLGLIAVRAVVAALLRIHPLESSIIAVVAGALFWMIARRAEREYEDLPIPEGYPLREIAMDVAVMGPVCVLIYLLNRIA